jgi:hypothetical protein
VPWRTNDPSRIGARVGARVALHALGHPAIVDRSPFGGGVELAIGRHPSAAVDRHARAAPRPLLGRLPEIRKALAEAREMLGRRA